VATIGKWWGRTRLVYKASPGWVPAGSVALGPYVYEAITGKWFGVFGGIVDTSFSAFPIYIRERYALSNLASVDYQISGHGSSLFAYGGFLYGLRKTDSAGGSLILFKVNVLTGAVSDVHTIYSATYLYSVSMAFDGVQTVYIALETGAVSVNHILKYDLGSDILTSLRNESVYAGVIYGVGVNTSNVYWLIFAGGVQWYTCMMTTGGASFAAESYVTTESIQRGILGYKGFYFFNRAAHTIQIQGGPSFDVVHNSMSQVFVDDSQGVANARFCTFGGGATPTAFCEMDGVTQKTALSLAGHPPSSNMFVSALRPESSIEEATTIVAHDTDYWWEAPSNMKEIV
jgi:hypothetical protein